MCKLFSMTSLAKVKVTPKFLGIVRDAVCRLGDRDGFGYSVSDACGQVWGERTKTPFKFDPMLDHRGSKTRKLPIVNPTSNSFGPVGGESSGSFVAHGRMSTNTVSLANTHPFNAPGITLFHNGVVSDPGKVVSHKLVTNCDTEILLRLWERGGMEDIESHAGGYYAVIVQDSKGVLHVARDSRAVLYMAWSPTVRSYLIATTTEILDSISKRMGWILEPAELFSDNTYATFQGNELTGYRTISPIGYDSHIDRRLVSVALDSETLTDDDEYRLYEGMLNDDDAPAYRRG